MLGIKLKYKTSRINMKMFTSVLFIFSKKKKKILIYPSYRYVLIFWKNTE